MKQSKSYKISMILLLLFFAVSVSCFLISAFRPVTAETNNEPSFTTIELDDSYAKGTELSVPEVTMTLNGQNYVTQAVLHEPYGSAEQVYDTALLDTAGIYTLEYKATVSGVTYCCEDSFSVYQPKYEFTSSNCKAEYSTTAVSGMEGEYISLAQDETLIIRDYFDITQATISEPIFEASIIPAKVGAADFERLTVRFVSKNDPSQYLEVVCNYYTRNNNTYYQAGANTQTVTGYEANGGTLHVGNTWGSPQSGCFNGTYPERTVKFYLDYETKTVYAGLSDTVTIDMGDNYTCPLGMVISVATSDVASVSLQTDAEIYLEGNNLLVMGSGSAIVTVTSIYGNTATKTIAFTVAGEMVDRTDVRLFDYELNSESVSFTLPGDVSDVARISFGTSAYVEKDNGFTVSGNTVTIAKSVLDTVSNAYGEYTITLATPSGSYYTYGCSFVTKIIDSYEELTSIRYTKTLDGYYILGSSFTADNEEAMPALLQNWSSSPDEGFIGIFDGRGHSITNLKLGKDGMFYCLGSGTIRNLALVNVTVETSEWDADKDAYAKAVFGSSDCQSTTFENLFISTNAKAMINMAYRVINVKNVVFVTSHSEGCLSVSGNNNNSGSYTLENVAVVGSALYGYYGGTPTQINASVYASVNDLFAAMSETYFEAWSDMFSYSDGQLLFNGTAVLNNNT